MSISSNITTLLNKLPSGVSLCAVSKFHPLSAVMEAYDAGQRIFGESRPQELAAKASQLPDDIKWHFIGHLQTNKVAMIMPFVTLIQSVDSLRLLSEISRQAVKLERTVDVLLEVHIAVESSKQGIVIDHVHTILGNEPPEGVRIIGLMGMATYTDDMEVVAREFDILKDLYNEFPELTVLSMGMSSDWEVAIDHGSNMVRIGSAIFGSRAANYTIEM